MAAAYLAKAILPLGSELPGKKEKGQRKKDKGWSFADKKTFRQPLIVQAICLLRNDCLTFGCGKIKPKCSNHWRRGRSQTWRCVLWSQHLDRQENLWFEVSLGYKMTLFQNKEQTHWCLCSLGSQAVTVICFEIGGTNNPGWPLTLNVAQANL